MICFLLGLVFLMGILNIFCYLYFRRRFVVFSEEILRSAQRIMGQEKELTQHNRETLASKVVMELEKVEEIVSNRLRESEGEKEKLQRTISDISHQLKTPLSNISMYHDMIADPKLTSDESEKFMEIIRQQLEKLEFLIDSLIKSSRLESDMIHLNIEDSSIFYTLKLAVNGIVQKADKKDSDISIHCAAGIKVPHDVKWTAEAIENILDNAVKYTQQRGNVSIHVVSGEMYTEIKIKDTGKGIPPEHYNDIFKRFYREKSVVRDEGLGLGLYIARSIIVRQGGHIIVRSAKGKGSCFSLFLPCRKRM